MTLNKQPTEKMIKVLAKSLKDWMIKDDYDDGIDCLGITGIV